MMALGPRARFALACLITAAPVGIVANMRARLLQRDRFDFDDGTIVEMVIWSVPRPLKGSAHAYKYRLFFARPGERIIGYDNEYQDVETLVRDFVADIERWRLK